MADEIIELAELVYNIEFLPNVFYKDATIAPIFKSKLLEYITLMQYRFCNHNNHYIQAEPSEHEPAGAGAAPTGLEEDLYFDLLHDIDWKAVTRQIQLDRTDLNMCQKFKHMDISIGDRYKKNLL